MNTCPATFIRANYFSTPLTNSKNQLAGIKVAGHVFINEIHRVVFPHFRVILRTDRPMALCQTLSPAPKKGKGSATRDYLETWTHLNPGGSPPTWNVACACASAGHYLYTFGGSGLEGSYTGSLYQLDTATCVWTELAANKDGPMKKNGCGMVVHEDNIVLFGGVSGPGSERILTKLIAMDIHMNCTSSTSKKVRT